MFEDIVLKHAQMYPRMQPADYIKLAFQHVFGPGHLIRDEARARRYLSEELASAEENGESLYTDIGNGLCRLNLPACRARNMSEEEIFDIFLRSAQRVHGEPEMFLKALDALSSLNDNGLLPAEPVRMDTELMIYRASGIRQLHHSDIYRAEYKPAYRVVIRQYLKRFIREK